MTEQYRCRVHISVFVIINLRPNYVCLDTVQRFCLWMLGVCDGAPKKALETLRCLSALCGMAPVTSLCHLFRVRSALA